MNRSAERRAFRKGRRAVGASKGRSFSFITRSVTHKSSLASAWQGVPSCARRVSHFSRGQSTLPSLFQIFCAISAAFRIHGERLGHALVTFVLVPPSTRNRMHAPIWHAGQATYLIRIRQPIFEFGITINNFNIAIEF